MNASGRVQLKNGQHGLPVSTRPLKPGHRPLRLLSSSHRVHVVPLSELSSSENTFDECHEWGSGQYWLLLTVRSRSTRNSLPRRRSLLSPLPHSWHSWHWFIDYSGPCTARACTGACDSRKGGVPCPFVEPFTYSSSTSRLLRSSRMQMRLRSGDQAAHRGEQT